jgi:hypothetical protein
MSATRVFSLDYDLPGRMDISKHMHCTNIICHAALTHSDLTTIAIPSQITLINHTGHPRAKSKCRRLC